MMLHIKWWVKGQGYCIARVDIEVPNTFSIVWITTWVIWS
jgi:hypothetical protein